MRKLIFRKSLDRTLQREQKMDLQWWRSCSHRAFQDKEVEVSVHPVLHRREGKIYLSVEELRLYHSDFWKYFRRSVGHLKVLLQMLALHLRSTLFTWKKNTPQKVCEGLSSCSSQQAMISTIIQFSHTPILFHPFPILSGDLYNREEKKIHPVTSITYLECGSQPWCHRKAEQTVRLMRKCSSTQRTTCGRMLITATNLCKH